MHAHKLAVYAIVHGTMTVSEAARHYEVSRQHLHRLLARYHAEGPTGLDPKPRTPNTHPHAIADEIRARIIELRHHLTNQGLDAGPETIAWHLTNDGHTPPATSTIRRVLTTAGLVTPEPRKRPKSALHHFEAAQPNETWQSDFTHWHLANNRHVIITNWLDDHSRYLLNCTASTTESITQVIDTFTTAVNTYGLPASTLTDNGVVYTARFVGGTNRFERLFIVLGITQKNGSPGHPQTQGKIERFHQTLKQYLRQRPDAKDLPALQTQLDEFRHIYNTERPHRALGSRTPATTYHATAKATPTGTSTDRLLRIRHDHIDKFGKLTLRHNGRLRHLGVGIIHAKKPVIMLVTTHDVTVIHLESGELVATHTINDAKAYWRNQQNAPGRWPGAETQ